MTVKELRKLLEGVDENRIVIMSSDGEGNSFSPLADVNAENQSYAEDSTWSGEVGFEVLTEELKKDGYEEGDVTKGVPCIVLWPTN